MDLSELQEKFSPILRQYWLPILLGVFGFVFLLYGLISSISHQNQDQDILAEGVSDEQVSPSTRSGLKQITIDIEGAVLRPGVYKLEKDARIQDALIVSGGMSDKADREKVAKSLNLASKVVDGGKIYIPFVGDTSAVIGSSTGQGPSTGSLLRQGYEGQAGTGGESVSGLININSASSSELDTLAGVGPATSEKIISNRPYEKIEDLLSKKVVGASVFEKIKDKISVY